MELSGADILVQCLKEEKVEYLFGYPGGAVLHIYDALYRQDVIKHILVRHEQGATHAADGYARSTGRPGVVLVTSGPGLTNAVTGIATAYMDSTPMVVICGQVPRRFIGSDAFQEIDAVGVTRPCVKHNFLVQRLEDLASTMRKAFFLASSGRPGPVVVDVPKDLTAPGVTIPFHYPDKIRIRSYSPNTRGHRGQLKKAVEQLRQARRPMIYSGGGVIIGEASERLTQLTRQLGFPITSTLMGLGAYPAPDPQFLGMLGMHGTYEANMAMHHCDTLLAIGARFDDRVTGEIEDFCPQAKIVHIDIDPSSIAKNVPVHIPIVGDVASVLDDMQKLLPTAGFENAAAIAPWWQQIRQWQETKCLAYQQDKKVIKPQYVIDKLWQLSHQQDCYVTSDVGQHQMFAAQFYHFKKPRRWLNSGGLGTMGFGLPAAMGAAFAHPDAPVFCITGEGSIQMCIQELSTCKQYELPIKIINLNNRYLGMVRQWQEFFYDRRYSHSYVDALPDFAKLAESYGHVGMRIEKPEDVEQALRQAMALRDKLVFLDFIVDPEENVYPMIMAGKGHQHMHLSTYNRDAS